MSETLTDISTLRAAGLLDEILTLFHLYDRDYNAVDSALQFIAEVRAANPELPLTVPLAEYMRRRGLID